MKAWPLIVDGVIVVSTVAVVALAGEKAAWYPWTLLIGGAAVSVTANSLHAVVAADADVPGPLAAAVAAVPPVVLLAITHLTVVLTRSAARPADVPETTRGVEPVADGAELIECCGAFGPAETVAVQAAVAGRVPVGTVKVNKSSPVCASQIFAVLSELTVAIRLLSGL